MLQVLNFDSKYLSSCLIADFDKINKSKNKMQFYRTVRLNVGNQLTGRFDLFSRTQEARTKISG